MAEAKRARGWCFTYNNYTEEGENAVREYGSTKGVRYLGYGREVGESGTPHLQGFVYYDNPRTFSSVRKQLPHGCHVEPCKGSMEQNYDYCSKDDDYFEVGDRPWTQGDKGAKRKRDWEEVIALARKGDEASFEASHPDLYFRHLKTFRSHRSFDLEDMPHGSRHIWYVGATGTGKSHRARQHTPFYLKLPNKWWDGYNGEDTVVYEEWSPDDRVRNQALKRWTDRYSFNAEIKGGMIHIRPKLMIVTSNYTMRECFPDDRDYLPLKRRFKEILCIDWVNEEEIE